MSIVIPMVKAQVGTRWPNQRFPRKSLRKNWPCASHLARVDASWARENRASAQTHSDDSVRRPLPCLPGEGRDPVLPWAPAFAGVTELLISPFVRARLANLMKGLCALDWPGRCAGYT